MDFELEELFWLNKNQIDFITINRTFSNAVKSEKTYPGADCNLLVSEINIKFKIVKKDLNSLILGVCEKA